MKLSRALIALVPIGLAGSVPALTFNLTYTSGTPTAAQNSFLNAANSWAALFTDPITVNLQVGLANLGSGVLGSTNPITIGASYASVRTGLTTDATSANDLLAAAGLQLGPNLSYTTNYFADNPNSNRATPFTATATALDVSRANAKAIGLLAGNNSANDGTINFATAYQTSYDYNPSDGIGGSQIDFQGIATHEIGHALGFFSGVEFVDSLSTTTSNTSTQFRFVTPLDLFRRSGVSTNPDLTAGTTAKYFSLDNGLTNATAFSLGVSKGDGAQASHWKDNLGLGIMDPTAADGELLAISANDIRGFDVIGYNLAAVPEPASLAALGLGAAALLRRRRRA